MIVINKLEFSNVFSYGPANVIYFDKDIVTQLLGENGAGKSSIATILEESLYNKNSRGIKKADIVNRNTEVKGYFIHVCFTDGSDSYELTKIVKSATKVTLLKNGEDISGHTATQTYKMLEKDILKLDFPTFTKLVYQSMTSSLDFLKATDTARKNFLIGLLGLESYSVAEQSVKDANREAKQLLSGAQASVNVIQSWITKHGKTEEQKVERTEEVYDEALDLVLYDLKNRKDNIDKDNKAASTNLMAKNTLNTLQSGEPEQVEGVTIELASATKDRDLKQGAIDVAKAAVNKLKLVKDKCPTCNSPLDIGDTLEILLNSRHALAVLQEELIPLSAEVTSLTTISTKYKTYQTWKRKFDVAKDKYDETASIEKADISTLNLQIINLETSISTAKASIKTTQDYNKTVAVHNARVISNEQQLEKYKLEIADKEKELEIVTEVAADLSILSTALGTKGLIQYKIESMIKVFEKLINQYLEELSDGRFLLTFIIADTKLSLNLYDNGKLIDIKSLSSGEFAKVNTATLLAVRKMMNAVSKVNINLVIFDEVISVLDEHGKETLVEILLKEKDLNSVLVSHGYNHPLANVIEIKKEEEISCIIY